jgi:hypothetical protein
MWGAPSDERTGLSFTIAAVPRQRRHFRVRVPRNSSTFYCLRFQTSPTWRARSRIYIPQGQGGLDIYPGIGFPLPSATQRYGGDIGTRLHAGNYNCPAYNIWALSAQKTLPHCCSSVAVGKYLFAMPLLSNDCCMFACLAVVAQQRV